MATTETQTYMNRDIGGDNDLSGSRVTDGDGEPMHLEVCASVGEFEDGMTIVEVHAPGDYTMVCLDFTAAHRLMLALQDALAIHARHVKV